MGNWTTNPDGSAKYDDSEDKAKAGGETGQPGWGPIKISGTYNPDPQHPGDFWNHLGAMPPQGPPMGSPMQGLPPGPQAPMPGGMPGPQSPMEPSPEQGGSPELIQQLMQRQGGM